MHAAAICLLRPIGRACNAFELCAVQANKRVRLVCAYLCVWLVPNSPHLSVRSHPTHLSATDYKCDRHYIIRTFLGHPVIIFVSYIVTDTPIREFIVEQVFLQVREN